MHGRLCALQKEKYKNEDRIKAEPRVKIRGGGGGVLDPVRKCSITQEKQKLKLSASCFALYQLNHISSAFILILKNQSFAITLILLKW